MTFSSIREKGKNLEGGGWGGLIKSFVTILKKNKKNFEGGSWEGYLSHLWLFFFITCCWNIPWYVIQNFQFKKGCRLYSTMGLQIISFFITICFSLFHPSVLCFMVILRLSSFVPEWFLLTSRLCSFAFLVLCKLHFNNILGKEG